MTIANAYLESREQLLEAVREIQLMAGIGEANEAALARFEQQALLAERMVAGVGARGFKAIRPAVAGSRPQSCPRPLAIGVTSIGHDDGKTTVAIALANCLALDYGAQVTLLDGDFATSCISSEFGIEGRPGLTDVLDGQVTLQAATHRFARSPLAVVTAGSASRNPARAARSHELERLVDDLKATNGFVVVDLPATLRSMNAPVLAHRCDGVIVVVRAGATTRQDLDRVLDLLAGANVLGVVVNRFDTAIPSWAERMLGLRR